MKNILIFLSLLIFQSAGASEDHSGHHWMKIKAKNKIERSRIHDLGVTIERVDTDYVVAIGNDEEFAAVKKTGMLLTTFEITTMDFPSKDSNFHNYQELMDALRSLEKANPDIMRLETIGTSLEGREIIDIHVNPTSGDGLEKPGIVFTGTHHAREHLSTEMPYLLAKHLVEKYKAGDPRIVKLLDSRDVHIIPMVNPDGVEHDIESGSYKMWRKNRKKNSGGSYGVDLNRNYGFGWGGGGASTNPRSDTYRGTSAFSEPETQAIKRFVESHENISILLSFHTFSELILYPWGHKYDSISVDADKRVHETMARTMSKWNNYTPQQSSDLYIASGDTTDWSYGEHKIISFTFELDPKTMWSGGFYPGQSYIPRVFQKNIEPCLYLIEYADNPYRVLNPKHSELGFQTPIF